MGNSNSSSVQVGHHPIPSSKWSTDPSMMMNSPGDARNRMKKSYFPPKHYMANGSNYPNQQQPPHHHPLLVKPQHLVLPKKVDPKELRLKPTSNGAILHGGGTISGRKMNELDLSHPNRDVSRKKSSNSSSSHNNFDDTGISGLSTPNLSSLVDTFTDHDEQHEHESSTNNNSSNAAHFKGQSKRRGYESDPDFRLSSYNSMTVAEETEEDEEEDERGLRSLQPSSFTTTSSTTLISESPAERQIRCRKKSHAPMPPLKSTGTSSNNNSSNGSGGGNSRTIIGDGIVIESYTKSTDPQRELDLQHDKHVKKKLNRMFKTKDERKFNGEKNNGVSSKNNGEVCDKDHGSRMSSSNNYKKEEEVPEQPSSLASSRHDFFSSSASSSTPAPLSREAISGRAINNHSNNVKSTTTKSEMKTEPSTKIDNDELKNNNANNKEKKKKRLNKNDDNTSSTESPSRRNHHDEKLFMENLETQKKTFYFGMEEDSTNTMRIRSCSNNNKGISDNNNNAPLLAVQQQSKYSSSSSATTSSRSMNPSSPSAKDTSNASNNKNLKHTTSSSSSNNNPKNADNNQFANIVQNNNHGKEQEVRHHNSANVVDENKKRSGRTAVEKNSSLDSSLHVKSERVGVCLVVEDVVGGINTATNLSQGRNNEQRDRIDDKNFITATTNKMGQRSSCSSSTSPAPRQSQSSNQKHHHHQQTKDVRNLKQQEQPKSGSDSDGIHHRQDSGNFDDFNESSTSRAEAKNNKRANKALVHGTIHESSSSDLSSSEMDIPILLRPTLPQKRHQLPRFSPASAWRSLDSPPVSGRSLSSEEGFNNCEDGIQRYNTRPIAPSRNVGCLNERSGDSGISAGDSPAIPDIIVPPIINKSYSTNNKKDGNKCWTPEQDLDESSSEFDENDMASIGQPIIPNGPGGGSSSLTSSAIIVNSNGPRTPPKLTTKKHFFSSAMYNNSDSELTTTKHKKRSQHQQHSNEEFMKTGTGDKNIKQSLYARSSKTKQSNNGGGGGALSNICTNFDCMTPTDVVENNFNAKPSLRRIQQRNNNNQFNFAHRKSIGGGMMIGKSKRRQQDDAENGFLGLDTNWFLSKSEPNSLNNLTAMTCEPFELIRQERRGKEHDDDDSRMTFRGRNGCYMDESENDVDDNDNDFGRREVHSEIGYGPSSLNNNYYYCHSYSNNGRDHDHEEFGVLRRPFSQHIIYLPSYDSRRFYPSSSSYYGCGGESNSRRAKSVDNLDSVNVIFQPSLSTPSSHNHRTKYEQFNSTDRNHSFETRRSFDKLPNGALNSNHVNYTQKKKVDEIPKLASAIDNSETNFAEQYKRKKFKFQSTLRVLERKQIERQLAQEAHEKEMERLREIEAMKAVEEEFQKKRAKEKLDLQSQEEGCFVDVRKKEAMDEVVKITPWCLNNRNSKPNFTQQQHQQEKSYSNNNHGPTISHQIFKSSTSSSISNASQGPTSLPNYGIGSNCISGRTTVLSIVNNSPNHGGNGNENGGISITNGSSSKQLLSNKSSSSSSNNSSGIIETGGKVKRGSRIISTININQRQEPEGAPSSTSITTPNDLRRELIQASRKRNGTNSSLSSSTDPLSTQELSEYKQETRQYWDYCRKSPKNGRQYISSQHPPSVMLPSNSSRHGDSSSDIYPVSSKGSHGKGRGRFRSTTTTIHPEVICDIPARPIYSNRLSGSASNILDDRSSLMGEGSGPSSVISDNYRRDWVHKNSGGSIIHIGAGNMDPSRRASSIVSLHSAPGYTSSSDNFMHSNSITDLSVINANNYQHHNGTYLNGSPQLMTRNSKSPTFQKLETGQPPSFAAPIKSSRTNAKRCNNPMDQNSVILQPQPFSSNKSKEFRPVVFKPSSSSSSQLNSLS